MMKEAGPTALGGLEPPHVRLCTTLTCSWPELKSEESEIELAELAGSRRLLHLRSTIPHPLPEPVLEVACLRLQKFYSQTFWSLVSLSFSHVFSPRILFI